jgi:DNA-binding transcriptional regulator YdaS (Cro superfamily)
MLVNGMKAEQIARLLGVTGGTVNQHIANARKKTRVSTREELIAWAVWTGMAVPGQIPSLAAARSRYGTSPSGRSGQLPDALARNPLHDNGDKGGRPTVMTPERISIALGLLGRSSVTEVARTIGVGRSTLYQFIRGARTAVPNLAGQRVKPRPAGSPGVRGASRRS